MIMDLNGLVVDVGPTALLSLWLYYRLKDLEDKVSRLTNIVGGYHGTETKTKRKKI